MPESQSNPDKTRELAEFNDGMRPAIIAMGQILVEQDLNLSKAKFDSKTYPDGTETHGEIWDVPGQSFDLSTHTQSGLYPRRNDGSVDLKSALTDPPDGNGRTGIFFDNGKSVFIQDGVAYIFGTPGEDGKSPLVKSIPIDEVEVVKVGQRDSFWIVGDYGNGDIKKTEIVGKPVAVKIETLI